MLSYSVACGAEESKMQSIYLLIPLSVILVAVAIAAFFWAVRSGQFDDLDSPALDILDRDEDD